MRILTYLKIKKVENAENTRLNVENIRTLIKPCSLLIKSLRIKIAAELK
jgi:hypothetical protein